MNKNTGYRGMLRHKCPQIVNFALKWCSAKERWLNHTYKNFVHYGGNEFKKGKLIRTANQNKRLIIRALLGLNNEGKSTHFDFDRSIDWDDLTKEDEKFWRNVSDWVRWFTENFIDIRNTYNTSRSNGKDEFNCKVEIIQTYLKLELPSEKDDEETKDRKFTYVNNLTDYLVNCIEIYKEE